MTNVRVVPTLEDDCVTASACGSCIEQTEAASLCTNIARVTAILKTAAGIREQSLDCLSAYSLAPTFENVPVGDVQALWVVEGAVPAQVAALTDAGVADAGIAPIVPQPATCTVHASSSLTVHAGACQGVPIAQGLMTYDCENTAAACSDNKDNDGDDRIDCADPKCQRYCVSPAPGPARMESEQPAQGTPAN